MTLKNIKEKIKSVLNEKHEVKFMIAGFCLGDIIFELLRYLLEKLF